MSRTAALLGRNTLLALVLAFRASVSAGDVTPSDTCVEAPVVDEGVWTGSTVAAGSDGSAGCGVSSSSPDAWLRWIASETGVLTVSTCGSSYDTVLSVHSGCPGDESTEIACNDDDSDCELQSTLAIDVEAGSEYLIRVSGFNQATGAFALEIDFEIPVETDGPDAAIVDLGSLVQRGRLGSEVALSLRTTICNLGDEPMDWFRNPDPRHPFLVFNLHRLENDRVEQIGASWVKHGFSASQGGGCGGACTPFGTSQYLGIGCSDVYGTGSNSNQATFGPRHEIDPWTGSFTFEGSHLDLQAGAEHDPVEHRLRVRDAEIDPARHPDARYFLELHVVTHDDVDHMNNVGFEEVSISGSPGGTWEFEHVSGAAELGSVLWAWIGAEYALVPEVPLDDGRCFVAAKATDNGDGTWRYTYSVYNIDMARAVRAFSVPVSADVAVSSPGFHAPTSHDEGFGNEPWTAQRAGGALTWSTSSFDGPAAANPLRWGTLYTFWFDADAAPTSTDVTLTPWAPGGDGALSGTVPAPGRALAGPRFRRGDADGSGVVEMSDAILTLGYLFLGSRAPSCQDASDADDNGLLEVSDSILVLSWLFNGGDAPRTPGPFDCGRDGDEEDPPLPHCVYGAPCD